MTDAINLITALANFGWVFFFLICAVYYTVKHLAFTLPLMRLRADNIAKHGWPPAHIDADGDYQGPPTQEDDEE